MNKAFEKILERLEEYIKDYSDLDLLDFFRGKVDAFKQARRIVQEVAEEYNGGWIPCSERLPEKEGVSILISCFNDVEYEFVQEAEFYRDDCGNPIFDCLCIYDKVLAWQPLPQPYKERG